MTFRSVALFALLAAAPTTLAAQSASPSPATFRARELVALINRSDEAALRAYIDTAMSPEMRHMRPQAIVDVVLGQRDQSPDLEWLGTQDETPTHSTALVKHKFAGERTAIEVQVAESAPHVITGLGQRSPRLTHPTPAAVEPRATNDAAMVSALKQYVEQLARVDEFSGTVLLAKNGKTLYAAAFGQANKDFNAPNTLDTKFVLGSMNTMFTAVAIAQLVEHGKLSYDDRIKHLLSEAADSDMLALGKVIEVVAQENYADYVRTHIYEAAGMTNTDAYQSDLVNPNLAVGYTKELQPTGTTRFRIRGGPGGGTYSTATDLLRFADALQAGTLISPASYELLTTTHGFGFAIDSATGASTNLDIFRGTGYIAVVLSNYDRASQPVVERIRSLVRSR
ncbi:MAG TPA: serine hydrolase domain-containing protein [Gemmatimonadaceae bacterium]|nr:serine hydrolase domain-containing protein [Gemmatimonadaceae bacterium]